MNEARRDPNSLAATVDLAAQQEGTPSAADPSRRVAVVEGGSLGLTAETQALLRARLRAAGLVMLMTTALFLARSLLAYFLLMASRFSALLPLHFGVTLSLAAGVALLSSRVPLSLTQLRRLELLIFGLMAVYLAARQYTVVLYAVLQNNPALLPAAAKSTLIFTFTVIVTYGMFIPNTWRRAAAVVLPMAALPIVVQIVLELRHPEFIGLAAEAASYSAVSEDVLMMLVGVVLSIYGTHIISTLRTEVYEARQYGQYQLRERIGSGGMGEVYLAEHRLLKRPCALKLIRPGRSADPMALARFEREVRITAQLSHPNTVEIYDYGRTEDGQFYYVMEYLRGLNLADLVTRHGPLPPGRVIYLLRQACSALAEAHSAGLIHRDLKPANLFAAERGGCFDFIKLLDFGLVKPTSVPESAALSRDDTITGSPHYMSPEQATGDRPPDARSDLYSMGAVAYFLLTARAPFEGLNAFAVMISHARDPVAPPSGRRPGLPEDLERIVLRCLAKDPAERFQEATELEEALASCRSVDEWDARRAWEWWHAVESAEAHTPRTSGVL